MPESPEVFNLVNYLNKKCKGMTLNKIKIQSGRYKKHGPPKDTYSFKKDLPMKLIEFNSKGKFIWITTDTEWMIIITLGLTGDIHISKPEENTRVLFKGSKCNLFFTDQRNFGTIRFSKDIDLLENKLDYIGQDPLRERVSFLEFEERLCKYHSNNTIADALLDQRVIGGIGTYLRSEILFNADQNPFQKVKNMSDVDLKHLLKTIKSTMKHFLNEKAEFKIYGQKYLKDGRRVKYKRMKDSRCLYYV